MQSLSKIYFILLSILFISFGCAQQNSENKKFDFTKVDSIIYNGINEKAFPGASLLINLDGETIYKKGFGKFTYESNSQDVNTSTIYDLASLTKVIATTTASMICIDKKYFSLNDKVEKYIPEFGTNQKENITIRNLLLHNSGLPAWKKFYDKNLTRDQILSDIYSSECEYKTGSKTVYSDLGMIVLGKVIEKVTNTTLDKFCENEIFKPLGMKNTFFNPPDSVKHRIPPTENDTYWRNRLIKGEAHDETASLLGGVSGHAGLFSNIEDIEKFLLMILNKGVYQNKRIINSETVELFTKRQSDENPRALGWDIKSETGSSAGNLFSKDSFGHTGFTGTSIWVDPDRNLFVVFLTNRVYPSRENKKLLAIRPQLHDAIIRAID
jgi:beta-N-acetylhexosaminidase